MTNVSLPHWQRHSQRRSRSRLRSSEARTTVSLPKTCPVMSVATPATPRLAMNLAPQGKF